MDRRYTFKIYPTSEQHERMVEQCEMVGGLWNALFHMQEERYRRTKGQRGVVHDPDIKPHLSRFDMTYLIKPLRSECPEWAALSSYTPARVIEAIDGAFAAFFRRAKQDAGVQSGYPRYKSWRRGEQNWLPHRFASGCKLEHVDKTTWRLSLKGIDGPIHARGKLPGEPIKWTHADIRLISGVWWLSVGVKLESRREPGDDAVTIELQGLDYFARVNGRAVYAWQIGLVDRESDRIARLQQAISALPRGDEKTPHLRQVLAKVQGKQARRRREVIHEWTTRIVSSASHIILVAPGSVKEATVSASGDKRCWGAAVKLKAEFNRHILFQAPAYAAAMIRYKASEAGVPLVEQTHEELMIGNMAVANRQGQRRITTQLRRSAA